MIAISATEARPDDPLGGLRIGEHPSPVVPDGWTIVVVHAASLNHHDLWTLRGAGAATENMPIVLGCDAAGRTADGRDVVVHSVIAPPGCASDGDELLSPEFSMLSERHDGTFAELVAVPEENLIEKPSMLSFEEAACLPTAYLTAYRALFTQARLRSGDSVLIQGAGGGFATASLVLARAAGIEAFVTSRSKVNRRRALELGAIDAIAPGARLSTRVDAVMESVGLMTWEHSLKAVRPGGRIVVVGATSGRVVKIDLPRLFYRQISLVGSLMGTRAELAGLLRLLAESGARPLIDSTMTLADGRRGFEKMWQGALFGKIVFKVV